MYDNREEVSKPYFANNVYRLEEYENGPGSYCLIAVTEPARVCHLCNEIFVSVPFVLIDKFGRPVCDECARILKLPVYAAKKAFDKTMTITRNCIEYDDHPGYHCCIAMADGLKPDFHSKALVETIAAVLKVHAVTHCYFNCTAGTYPLIRLTFDACSLPKEAIERAEEALFKLVESAQQEHNYISYFMFVDRRYDSFLLLKSHDDFTYKDIVTNKEIEDWLSDDSNLV